MTPERLAELRKQIDDSTGPYRLAVPTTVDELRDLLDAADNLAALLAAVSAFCDDELTHHMRVGWDRGPMAYVEHVHGEAEKLFRAAHAIRAKGEQS